MEQKKEMTAKESLELIAKTMDNSRRDILAASGKHLIFWGTLLTVFSLCIYLLWSSTGKAAWNFLWFAMPVVGLPVAALMGRRSRPIPENQISKMLDGVWSAYGVFATVSAALSCTVVPFNITVAIVLLFGFAESVSGIILKKWVIVVGGFILSMAGLVMGVKFASSPAQLLIFAVGGVLLVLTGLLIHSGRK